MASKFYTGIDLRGQRAVGAADGAEATDLVTLQQLQAYVRGLDWKQNVVAATTGNIDLASPGPTLDGVSLVAGDRVLVKNQTNAAENGIYDWTGPTTPLTRSADADSDDEVTSALTVTVLSGSATNTPSGTPTAWTIATTGPIVLDTTPLLFVLAGGGAAAYVAGAGLTLTGQTFNVGAGNGVLVDADAVRVDPSVVVRKYAASAAATTNPQTFTHGLGTDDVTVLVWEGTEQVFPGITKGVGTVTVDWGSAPAAGQYRVVVHG